ncbi:MAG TPA: efflux transporter outer membrane subunit [Steroidobacteraceae bacterium]|jgi:multidrug efflux system outer membrane protein|nr:efflux transporter outer membrane subunit [Steroidobacteraceae bacterium]
MVSKFAIISIASAAGCAVGPNSRPAPPSAPPAWDAPVTNGLTDKSSAASSWWASFNDAELDSLIERATQSNLDLRVAEARLQQARAVRAGTTADLAPQVNASASAARAKQSQNQPLIGSLPLPRGFPFEYSVYQAGFDASWELDVFGGQRRAHEAATADWEGAIEARNDAMVSLLAEVARNYVELRGSQQRLGIARRDLKLQEEATDLTRARFRGGVATELDVIREAALLASQQAAIPSLETTVRAAMHALAVLLARQPGELVAELSPVTNVPPVPPLVPIGLPADLLRRRPDVRRAERQLAAETARIGVAKSDWFPKVSLIGDAGAESVSVSSWFEPGSRFWSIGPSIQWKALDFGRVRAEVDAQTAVQEAALAAYQKAVLVSLQEAENAIVAYAQEQNRHRALSDAVAENRRALQLADSLYSYGRVNFLDVLDARRTLYQSDDQLALSDQSVSLDLIVLYKALGGGWQTLPQASALATARPP